MPLPSALSQHHSLNAGPDLGQLAIARDGTCIQAKVVASESDLSIAATNLPADQVLVADSRAVCDTDQGTCSCAGEARGQS
jgi:hypothetical protein